MATKSPQVGQLERKTQNRIAKAFQDKLGYDYLGALCRARLSYIIKA